MKAKYRVVVLGCLKNLNTEKEVVEEYRKYLSTIFLKKQVMSFSVIYEDGEKRGAIVATGRQISVISGSEEMISLAYKMRTSWEKNEGTFYFYEYGFGVFLHIPGCVFFKKRWSFYCKQEKQTMSILFARLLFEEL